MSEYIDIELSNLESVKMLATHSPTDKWLRLQGDIARYGRAQWVKFMNEKGGTVRFGTWPDDETEALVMENSLRVPPEREATSSDSHAPAEAETAMDDDDGEMETITLMQDLPDADVAEEEYTELVRRKSEYAEQTAITIHRRMFVSKNKGYIGMCPPLTQKGDQIWYLEDAAVPFVLRPRKSRVGHGGDLYEVEDQTHELIGEVFVHGLMGGELLDVKNGFRGKVKPIAIR